LRERRDDIPLLVRHFTAKYARKMDKDIRTIPGGALRQLIRWHWPGNIRELENLIERAVHSDPRDDAGSIGAGTAEPEHLVHCGNDCHIRGAGSRRYEFSDDCWTG
jgi:transcriptional regulator with PAS, ATPase and Fis domain